MEVPGLEPSILFSLLLLLLMMLLLFAAAAVVIVIIFAFNGISNLKQKFFCQGGV